MAFAGELTVTRTRSMGQARLAKREWAEKGLTSFIKYWHNLVSKAKAKI